MNLNLPPGPTLPALESPAIAKLIGEYRRLQELERDLQQKAYRLKTGAMVEANAADTAAVAQAVRLEKPIPKPAAVEKVKAQLDEVERHQAGASKAKGEAASELIEAVESSRPKLLNHLQELSKRRRKAVQDALEALSGAVSEWDEAVGLMGWATSFPHNKAFRASGGVVPGLLSRAGEPFTWKRILDELHDSAAGIVNDDPGPQLIPGRPQDARPQEVSV